MPPLSIRLVGRAAVIAACLGAAAASAQRLVVQPAAEVLVGTPLSLVVEGLPPGAPVTLRSERTARAPEGGRVLYAAEARFRADAAGRVDLGRDAPLSGSYEGADVQGLFWSAQRAAAPLPADLGESQVRLAVHLSEGAAAQPLGTLLLRRADPALVATPAPDFPGAVLLRLPGEAPRPALIALGGSEGGSVAVRAAAALLASHGYAVLALPYYSPPGWSPAGPTPPEIAALPSAFADIPVERVQAARDWLVRQHGVEAARVGLYGISKGAEYTLLAASRMPWVASAVAVLPSDVVWEGWGPGVAPGQRASFAWRGAPLPFVPYRGFAEEFQGFATGRPVLIRRPHDAGRAAHPQAVAAARIPVEDYAGPLLVIGADDDQVWDSGAMARAVAERRAAAGRETLALLYAGAGHGIADAGWRPTTATNAGPMKLGGTPAADARAMADAWPRTLEFLRRTLGTPPR